MSSLTRRGFVTTAALGTVAAATPALAQDQPRPARSQPELLAELVRLRFGAHLNEAQRKSIQQRLTRAAATSELLKQTRLHNGDEPAFVFVPQE